MSFFHTYHIVNKIEDLTELVSLKLNSIGNIGTLRRKMSILLIDDNDFPAEDYLKANGYQITHKVDIDTILEVQTFEIVMCDISGVGKKLGYEKEGATMIKEIRTQYPNKSIIAYSANTHNAEYNNYFSMASHIVPKDIGLDDWMDIIDQQIEKSINPIEQWKNMRENLFAKGVSTLTIARLEDQYVKAVKNNNPNILKKSIADKNSDVKSVIIEFLSSFCAKLFFEIITQGGL